MLIIHENMQKEAEHIAETLRDVYGFESKLSNKNLKKVFQPLPEFNGYWESFSSFLDYLKNEKRSVFVLTPRDMFFDNVSKEDDWAFGYSGGKLSVLASARLKRPDNKPSDVLCIPEKQYFKRLDQMAVHEVGHDVVHAKHMEQAIWVSTKNNHKMPLGPHCTDPSCVMYEVVDIKAPPKEEGYMLLGIKKIYNAGLDEIIEKNYPDRFCKKCKKGIIIPDYYKKF